MSLGLKDTWVIQLATIALTSESLREVGVETIGHSIKEIFDWIICHY
jgi:hypothetical protein